MPWKISIKICRILIANYIPLAFEASGANKHSISARISGEKLQLWSHSRARRVINTWILPAFWPSTRITEAFSFSIAVISSSGLLLMSMFASSQSLCRSRSRLSSLRRSISSISSTPSITTYTGPAHSRSVFRRPNATSMSLFRFSRLDRQRTVLRSSWSEASWNINEWSIERADTLVPCAWLRKAKIVRPRVFALSIIVPERNVLPIYPYSPLGSQQQE